MDSFRSGAEPTHVPAAPPSSLPTVAGLFDDLVSFHDEQTKATAGLPLA
ncbi:MAG TPA: hypothetical protein VII69_00035 [Candidatus Eremiobacteraceae bacterium]